MLEASGLTVAGALVVGHAVMVGDRAGGRSDWTQAASISEHDSTISLTRIV